MYNYNDFLSNDYFSANTTPTVQNNQINLYTPEEGYNKGNMFSNLYDGYKNYKVKELKGTNKKENDYLDMQRTLFALHELRLYLDVNPNNESMITLYDDYKARAMKQINDYERQYGPIMELNNISSSKSLWEKEKWPWEGENK